MHADNTMLRTNGTTTKTNRSSMYSNSPSASTSTSSNSTKSDMPQISSNNRWALWVKETIEDQPTPTPTASATAVIPDTRKSQTRERIHSNSNDKNNNIVPTNDQMELVLSDPIRCFCGKRAYRGYTLEYGPVLECGTFDMEESDDQITKFICGFHVHETSWISFREQLKAGNTITSEYPELRTCSRYNFSYCTMFRVKNQYTLEAPTKVPQCFCGRPVVLRVNHKDTIQLACRNAFVDGARKCSWILNVKDVAFPRSKQRIHDYIDQDKYFADKERQKNALLKKRADERQLEQEKHKNDLLATLSASIAQQSAPVQQPPFIAMASEVEDKDNVISFKDLTLQEQKLQAECSPTKKSLMIPTCVMSHQKKKNQHHQNQEQQQQPVPSSTSSSHSSSSSTITSPIMSSQNSLLSSSEETHLIKVTCRNQQDIIEQQKEIIERQKYKLKYERETNQQVTADLQTKLYRSQNDQDENMILRMHCQERLSSLEMEVVRLMNEKEKLTEELMVHIEKEDSLGKEEELNKCKLCYTKNIEYCLIPCYHLGKSSFVLSDG